MRHSRYFIKKKKKKKSFPEQGKTTKIEKKKHKPHQTDIEATVYIEFLQ